MWLSGVAVWSVRGLATRVPLRPAWISSGDICLTQGSAIWAETSAKPGPELVCFPVLSKVSFPGYFFGSFLCTGTVYQVLAPPAVGEQLCKDLASLVFQELAPQSESAFLRSPLPAIDCSLTVRVRGSLQDPQSQNGSLYVGVCALMESVYEVPKCGLAHSADF